MGKKTDGMTKYLTNLLNDNDFFKLAVSARQVRRADPSATNKHQMTVNYNPGSHRGYVYSIVINDCVYNNYFFSQEEALTTFVDCLVKNEVEDSFSFLRTKLGLSLPKLAVVYYPVDNLTFLLPISEINSAPGFVRYGNEIEIASVEQFQNLLKFATFDFQYGFYNGNIYIEDHALTLTNYSRDGYKDLLSFSVEQYGARRVLRELLRPLDELLNTFAGSTLRFELNKTELGYCIKSFADFKRSYYSSCQIFWHSKLGQKIVHFDLSRFKYLNLTEIKLYDFWLLLFTYISPKLKIALTNLLAYSKPLYLFNTPAEVGFEFLELNKINKHDLNRYAKVINSINVREDIIANGDNRHNFVKLLGNFAALPASSFADSDSGLFFYPILGKNYGIFGAERVDKKILLQLIKLTED